MPDIKPGSVIELSEEHVKALGSLKEKLDQGKIAHETAIELLIEARRELWDFVYEIYPALKDFHAVIDNKENVIRVLGHK